MSSRYSFGWIVLILLASVFFVPSCNVCHGDDEGDEDDLVRCAGNVLSSSSDSGTDNDISDLIDDPGSISEPDSVNVTQRGLSFSIYETEVTNEQFASFLQAKEVVASESGDGETNDCNLDNGVVALCYEFTGPGNEAKNSVNEDVFGGKARITEGSFNVNPGTAKDHPVTYVSWYAAREFCEIKGKRLPTVEEWKAAAGGNAENTLFPWIDPDIATDQSLTCERVNYADPNQTGGFCEGDTVDVNVGFAGGVATHDAFTIKHMLGNVAEWTSTLEGDSDQDDEDRDRIIKGGAWDDGASNIRIDIDTNTSLPGATAANIGFRCVGGLIDQGDSSTEETTPTSTTTQVTTTSVAETTTSTAEVTTTTVADSTSSLTFQRWLSFLPTAN